MPSALHYIDDTLVINESDNNILSFYASLLAVTALDTNAQLSGNLYQPVAPSPYVMSRYNQLYIFFYEQLDAILQAARADQQ